jgi:hypothetical protein
VAVCVEAERIELMVVANADVERDEPGGQHQGTQANRPSKRRGFGKQQPAEREAQDARRDETGDEGVQPHHEPVGAVQHHADVGHRPCVRRVLPLEPVEALENEDERGPQPEAFPRLAGRRHQKSDGDDPEGQVDDHDDPVGTTSQADVCNPGAHEAHGRKGGCGQHEPSDIHQTGSVPHQCTPFGHDIPRDP